LAVMACTTIAGTLRAPGPPDCVVFTLRATKYADFQPAGRAVVGHPGTRIRVDAATCIAGTELGWSADRTATANHGLVAVMANPAR
jgi:hypothetical protein